MKCLKIEKGRGYFRSVNGDYFELDQIKKDDLLYLLDIATSADNEFEMDNIDETVISNEAHKIIYQSLYDKFSELLSNKNRFLEESESVYKDALTKYSVSDDVDG